MSHFETPQEEIHTLKRRLSAAQDRIRRITGWSLKINGRAIKRIDSMEKVLDIDREALRIFKETFDLLLRSGSLPEWMLKKMQSSCQDGIKCIDETLDNCHVDQKLFQDAEKKASAFLKLPLNYAEDD